MLATNSKLPSAPLPLKKKKKKKDTEKQKLYRPNKTPQQAGFQSGKISLRPLKEYGHPGVGDGAASSLQQLDGGLE